MAMTTNTLFKGMKVKGNLLWFKAHSNSTEGWSFTGHFTDFEAHYKYRGPNDRTFIQKLEPMAKFPQPEESDIANTLAILATLPRHEASAIDFLRAWVYVEAAQSTDETRYALNGLCIDEGKMVATDGHRLHLYPNAFPTEIDGKPMPYRAIIPRDAATALVRALTFNLGQGVKTYTVALDDTGMYLSFRTASPVLEASFRVRLIDGQFPAYEQVVPTFDENDCVTLTGNVGTLAAALKTAPVKLDNKLKTITLSIDSGGFVFACDKDGNPDTVSLPVHATGWHNEERTLRVAFDLDYFKELFDGDGTFVARMAGELSPLRWEQGEAVGIIMPMRA